MFDNHVHSSYSGDSDMPAEAACEKAIEVGLEGIAFTDHLDIDYPDYDVEYLVDFDEYDRFMDNLKQKYKDKLKILKGVEVGIQPHVIEETKKTLEMHDFDFIIGSVHVVEGIDPYNPAYYSGRSKEQAYSRYLQEIFYMINSFDNFDVAGHFDFVIRKACYDDRNLRYCEHAELFDEILKALISKGKGFELNTASYREFNDVVTAKYDIGILKRYKELGGEIITMASDAHNPGYIGYKFDYFKGVLKEAGFKYATHFENRKPVFDKI